MMGRPQSIVEFAGPDRVSEQPVAYTANPDADVAQSPAHAALTDLMARIGLPRARGPASETKLPT